MIRQNFYKGKLTFKDKIIGLDYVLIISVLFLGIISIFAMYSSEQGKLGYYTLSHLYRFCVFFFSLYSCFFF